MALGIGSLGKKSSKAKTTSKSTAPKAANDAAEVLKKMEEKSDAGQCAFC
jgi:hypothetical protein